MGRLIAINVTVCANRKLDAAEDARNQPATVPTSQSAIIHRDETFKPLIVKSLDVAERSSIELSLWH